MDLHGSVTREFTLRQERNAPAPMKLYRARFSPATTDSSRKLYFESFAIRKYATHGVIKSPGSSTYTGTQFPSFSLRIMFSTVERGGNAGSFCQSMRQLPHTTAISIRLDLSVYRHVQNGRSGSAWESGTGLTA